MPTYFPNCVRLDPDGRQWIGLHIDGTGTQWQPMPREGTIVRPPPGDLRCEVCQRLPDEVPRFGGPGDPLPGDYSRAVLVKLPRSKGLLGSSWECRECAELTDERFERTIMTR